MRVFLFLWELPQTILAWIILAFYKTSKKMAVDACCVVHFIESKKPFGVSLGEYIILSKEYENHGHYSVSGKYILTYLHEFGHTRQSRMLGWLYLPIVGVPSLFFNLLTRAGVLPHNTYYTRYPEKWADRLGPARRNHRA